MKMSFLQFETISVCKWRKHTPTKMWWQWWWIGRWLWEFVCQTLVWNMTMEHVQHKEKIQNCLLKMKYQRNSKLYKSTNYQESLLHTPQSQWSTMTTQRSKKEQVQCFDAMSPLTYQKTQSSPMHKWQQSQPKTTKMLGFQTPQIVTMDQIRKCLERVKVMKIWEKEKWDGNLMDTKT